MTFCIIPARLNSSRFPAKLLAQAGGKTVLQRTFEQALLCFENQNIFIATDNEQIETHMRPLGGQVIRTSSSCQNGTQRIIEALRNTAALKEAKIIVNLQGDHPTIHPDTVRAAIQLLENDPQAVMSTAAAPLRNETDFFSPHVVKVVLDQHANALYFSRAPIPYTKAKMPSGALQHIGLYCFRSSFLLELDSLAKSPLCESEDLEQLKALEAGYRIKVALVDEPALGIDTPDDLTKLEKLLCR